MDQTLITDQKVAKMATEAGESQTQKAKDRAHPKPEDDPVWTPLDPETERGERGLTALLHHRLGDRSDGRLTYAQRLTQKLIDSALEGHARSLEEIFVRIDGEAKSRAPAAKAVKATIDMDETTALRILDALHDGRDHLAGH